MTLRVVPSAEVLTEVHLFDGELWAAPYCPVRWWPPFEDPLAEVVQPRIVELWQMARRLRKGERRGEEFSAPEPERATRCGIPVTNDPPWLEWPADDPLRTCRRCQSAESRDTPDGEGVEATLL